MFVRQILSGMFCLLFLSTASVWAADKPRAGKQKNIGTAGAKTSASTFTVDTLVLDEHRIDDSEAVKAVLAAHPGREMIICLAGCKFGQASILSNHPEHLQTVDASGGLGMAVFLGDGDLSPTSAPAQIAAADPDQQSNEAVCVAGCAGPLGVVVWRGMRLAWVREDRKEDLMSALRRIGDRLARQDASQAHAQEAAALPRVWVGAAARESLSAAFGAPSPAARFAAVSVRPRG